MELTQEQLKRVKKHAEWLSKEHGEAIYNRTIEIAGKYDIGSYTQKWLLYLANNVYINEYCNR